ncbi:hypothetical protein F4808DRAFT_422637 [Astrocystis sublimbata]|nr:hypothetical protein F4808DRAFT_422637 [Astrocystis sublimbata]
MLCMLPTVLLPPCRWCLPFGVSIGIPAISARAPKLINIFPIGWWRGITRLRSEFHPKPETVIIYRTRQVIIFTYCGVAATRRARSNLHAGAYIRHFPYKSTYLVVNQMLLAGLLKRQAYFICDLR